VKHLNTNQKFLVHTADRLTVEVLGTSFNVFKRPSGTRVVLQSGKVKLNIANAREAETCLCSRANW
jgi:ferric-dicitrate binding protein FerR (iron transport regulator)